MQYLDPVTPEAVKARNDVDRALRYLVTCEKIAAAARSRVGIYQDRLLDALVKQELDK